MAFHGGDPPEFRRDKVPQNNDRNCAKNNQSFHLRFSPFL
jgi:hypothetical protein